MNDIESLQREIITLALIEIDDSGMDEGYFQHDIVPPISGGTFYVEVKFKIEEDSTQDQDTGQVHIFSREIKILDFYCEGINNEDELEDWDLTEMAQDIAKSNFKYKW